MLVNQLSVFMENKEGRLEQVLETLAEGNININSLSLAEATDYGMLRMIVSDPEAGKKALKEKGSIGNLFKEGYIRLAPKIEFGENEDIKSYILITFFIGNIFIQTNYFIVNTLVV